MERLRFSFNFCTFKQRKMFRGPHAYLVILNNSFCKLHCILRQFSKKNILIQVVTYHKANYFLIDLFCFFSLLIIFFNTNFVLWEDSGETWQNLEIADVGKNTDSFTLKGRTKMNWFNLQLNRFQLKTKKPFKQRYAVMPLATAQDALRVSPWWFSKHPTI